MTELDPSLVTTQRGSSQRSPQTESFAERMIKLQKVGASKTISSSDTADSDYENKLRRLQLVAKEKEQLEKQMRLEHEQKVEQAWGCS